jgi:hypothetical protein
MSSPEPPRRQERRSDRRRAIKRSITVSCRKGSLGLGPNLAVALLDLSEGGVRLTVKEPLEHGQEIEIELTAPGQGRPLRLLATIVWAIAAADGTHAIGARFHRRMAYADLQRLT